tara:strand:- start:7987 stop:8184 length:198 start_codon:yes stop_codon:yes gene_type:complete
MNKLQKLIRQFRVYINEIQKNPNKVNYSKEEIINLHKSASFRNPLLDTIKTWEEAGKPIRIRSKY